jgi:uncharacterized protein DUF6288
MRFNRWIAGCVGVFVGAGVVVLYSSLVHAGQATYPMGEIGGRIALVEGQPTALEIKELYSGQPGALAKLQPGMFIVGAAGQPFAAGYMMPLKQLGAAIDGARRRDGGLDLNVLVGQKVQPVRVRLSNAPGFSSTFPFDCPRSEYIYDHVCRAMSEEFQAKGHLPGGPVTNSLAAMALLGHKSDAGRRIVEPYIMKVATSYASGENREGSVWLLSYGGVMLCEYYLVNPDPIVAKAISNIAKHMAANIPSHGRYGHHLRVGDRNSVAYDGQGLNATTSAALWFFASAARCGLDPSDIQPAFGMALERVRKETNGNGGVGYAWKGDHQSSMRSGHTALAWHHLVVSPQLVGPITSAQLSYRSKVASWPTRHADTLLEAHAVSSLGITASTAGLAALDRQQYQMLMQSWRWYFALAWQPNPSKYGQFEVAYVGGPNNTGGDFYLNGHRPLESGFCSIMNATVGFVLASSHERLSFYGGMPPIPGLTTTVLAQSPQLAKAFKAMRQNKFGLAMRIAVPLTEELTEDGEISIDPQGDGEDKPLLEGMPEGEEESEIAEVALAFIDYVDERILGAQFDSIDSLYEGEDVALTYDQLKQFSIDVKGIRKYEIDVDRMIRELNREKYADRLRVGKRFYALKVATTKGGSLISNLRKWEQFEKTCPDEYYSEQAQTIIDELRQARAFDEKWGDKDESAR